MARPPLNQYTITSRWLLERLTSRSPHEFFGHVQNFRVGSRSDAEQGRPPRPRLQFLRTCLPKKCSTVPPQPATQPATQQHRDIRDVHNCVFFCVFGFRLTRSNFKLYHFPSYGPRQANLVLIAYASSEGSGTQSRQNLLCSLIQALSQEEPSDRKPDP